MTSLTQSLNMSGYDMPMIRSAMKWSSFRKSASPTVPTWSWDRWRYQTINHTAPCNREKSGDEPGVIMKRFIADTVAMVVFSTLLGAFVEIVLAGLGPIQSFWLPSPADPMGCS